MIEIALIVLLVKLVSIVNSDSVDVFKHSCDMVVAYASLLGCHE